MRAENQRWASERPASTTASAGDQRGRSGSRRALSPCRMPSSMITRPNSSGVSDADDRVDHDAGPGRGQIRAGTGRAKAAMRRTVPGVSFCSVDRLSRRQDRMTARARAQPPCIVQSHLGAPDRRPVRNRSAAPPTANASGSSTRAPLEPAARPRSRRSWACAAPRPPAPPGSRRPRPAAAPWSRPRPSRGGASSAATRSATAPASSPRHDDASASPSAQRLRRADPAAGQADLQRPRVADERRPAAWSRRGRAPGRGCGSRHRRTGRRRRATRRSQASASWKPAPIACPCTAATETRSGTAQPAERLLVAAIRCSPASSAQGRELGAATARPGSRPA